MRAGRLDRALTLTRTTADTVDEFGTPMPGASEVIAMVRAQRIEATTAEFMARFGEGSATAVVYRIRYVPGLLLTDKVTEGAEVFDIKELKELGRRRGWEIRCTRAGG